MQWFINIIKEIVHDSSGYFKRDDNTPNDFAIGDLTVDGAWHVLDLGGIVPEDAQAVNLKVNIRCNVQDRRFDVRENGNINTVNLLSIWTQTANVRLGGLVAVNVDSDRKIEYRASGGGWNLIFLNVNGWWLR